MAQKVTQIPYVRPTTDRVILVEADNLLTSATGTESIQDDPTEYDWDPNF